LLPLGCEAVATPEHAVHRMNAVAAFGAASLPSGSKLPRHRNGDRSKILRRTPTGYPACSGHLHRDHQTPGLSQASGLSNANPWQVSLLPLGCEAVATPEHAVHRMSAVAAFGAASLPSGSKLPRHRNGDRSKILRRTPTGYPACSGHLHRDHQTPGLSQAPGLQAPPLARARLA
jgi:hypothetical protein